MGKITIERDENFFKDLEKTINDEIKETDRSSNRFKPNYWPQTVKEYQKHILGYHERRRIPVPRGFWKKNKEQLKGMYFGIVHNSAIKRYKYGRLIEEIVREFNAPVTQQLLDDIEIGRVDGNTLKKTYGDLKSACEAYISHIVKETDKY